MLKFKGETILLSDVRLRKQDQFGIQFGFVNNSKIGLKHIERPSTVPMFLKDLEDFENGKHFSKYSIFQDFWFYLINLLVNIRLRVIRNPSSFDARKKMLCTFGTDGINKCQLIYVSTLSISVGTELTVKSAEVERKSKTIQHCNKLFSKHIQ